MPAHVRSVHIHAPDHRHDALGDVPDLPLSIMAQSAAVRAAAVTAILVLLWLAVLWAISLP